MTQAGTSYESSLLLTLGEITQLIVHSRDPAQTLANIVALIQGRFHTDVCSVYFFDPDTQELVLGATVGLDPRAVGRVRMRLDEGLTGLVAQQLSPVMVADAVRHPRFKYFPEAGEDPYQSFLGVPLVEGGTLEGVLVVQTKEPRTFSPSEIRTLLTVAAQLAPLVGDAQLLGRVAAAAHEPEFPPEGPGGACTLQGVALSPGAGLGQAYVVDSFDEWRRTVCLTADDPRQERARLTEAVSRAREEITRLSQHISELVGENHGAILQAQVMIMQDRSIEKDLDACLAAGASAEGALFATLDKYVAAFQRVSTPFFQERVYDIKDVFHRLLWQLRPRPTKGQIPSDREGGDRVVLVAREASVMELFAVDLPQLAGVVVEHGGTQSHAAILARSLGIPMVGQVSDFSALAQPGRRLLVDGTRGTVIVDPPADCVVPAITTTSDDREPALLPLPEKPRIEVNINLLYEARPAVKLGASGVGLYRSEFLFLARRTLPTEEEQVEIYRKLLQTLDGRPVCVRTFDLRPDKLASYSHMGPAAARPFDWRRVLESPPLQQLFRDQVRAVLRAASVGPARILVPLVSRTEVLDFVLETMTRARATLVQDGLEHDPHVPLGVMIEVAAAVPLMGAWAPSVDFFALGTNDLTATALGLDRDDPATASQIDALHPGVLRLIADAATSAHVAGKPVSVCGEIAADPLGALAMAALEVDTISVPVNQFPAARQALAGRCSAALRALRPTLLAQRTAEEVRGVLRGI